MIKNISLFLCLSFWTLSSQATLVGRLEATPGAGDYQAYYDTEADLTWLANANAGAGSVFDDEWGSTIRESSYSDGMMTWSSANAWAASLEVNGVTNWRLPAAVSCFGRATEINCTDSEMMNLIFNVLGGTADRSLLSKHNLNYNLFSNIQRGVYWSSTTAYDESVAWGSNTALNFQRVVDKSHVAFAWAVHSGDVSAVPVPSAVWLFGSGLIGLIGLARRKANA